MLNLTGLSGRNFTSSAKSIKNRADFCRKKEKWYTINPLRFTGFDDDDGKIINTAHCYPTVFFLCLRLKWKQSNRLLPTQRAHISVFRLITGRASNVQNSNSGVPHSTNSHFGCCLFAPLTPLSIADRILIFIIKLHQFKCITRARSTAHPRNRQNEWNTEITFFLSCFSVLEINNTTGSIKMRNAPFINECLIHIIFDIWLASVWWSADVDARALASSTQAKPILAYYDCATEITANSLAV